MTYRRIFFPATYFDFPCGTEATLIKIIKYAERFVLLACIVYWIFSTDSDIPFLTALAISVHELGHVLFSHLLSCELTKIKAEGGGLRLLGQKTHLSYVNEALVAFGGPLFNLISAVTSHILVGNGYFVQVSLSLALLNLLPISSFDGSKILGTVAYQIFPWRVAENICAVMSFLSLFLIWCTSIYILIKSGRNIIPFLFSAVIFIKVITHQEKA